VELRTLSSEEIRVPSCRSHNCSEAQDRPALYGLLGEVEAFGLELLEVHSATAGETR